MKQNFRTILFAIVAVGLVGNVVEAQKVVSIEVQGKLRKVAKSLILTTVGLESGVELSQENVQQAVRDLQGLNVFEDIQIWGDPVPQGINLIIMVEEYPALEGLQFKGQKNVKEKDLKEALSLVTGQVIAPRDVVRGEQKILDLYREKGYLRAEVKGQTFAGAEEGEVFLQYDINEGSKVQIKQIRLIQQRADGTVIAIPGLEGDARHFGIRPEHIRLASGGAAILTGTVGVAEHLGSDSFVHVDVPGMEPVNVRIAGGADISEDQEAGLDFDLADAHIFDEDGRRLDIC